MFVVLQLRQSLRDTLQVRPCKLDVGIHASDGLARITLTASQEYRVFNLGVVIPAPRG